MFSYKFSPNNLTGRFQTSLLSRCAEDARATSKLLQYKRFAAAAQKRQEKCLKKISCKPHKQRPARPRLPELGGGPEADRPRITK
jgi:hypothetical protein